MDIETTINDILELKTMEKELAEEITELYREIEIKQSRKLALVSILTGLSATVGEYAATQNEALRSEIIARIQKG